MQRIRVEGYQVLWGLRDTAVVSSSCKFSENAKYMFFKDTKCLMSTLATDANPYFVIVTIVTEVFRILAREDSKENGIAITSFRVIG